MNATSAPIPPEWIARLFTRFQSVYGSKAEMMWGKADPADLRQAWGETLAGYDGENFRDALEAMLLAHPEYPPTLPKFADLCRDSRIRRRETVTKISGPRTEMPEEIKRKLRAFVGGRVA